MAKKRDRTYDRLIKFRVLRSFIRGSAGVGVPSPLLAFLWPPALRLFF